MYASWINNIPVICLQCHEKVARTFELEAFVAESDMSKTRMYEREMTCALETYSSAFEQAKLIEDEGSSRVEQAGGSAHGAAEVFYRVHASRLKCLIHAVCQSEEYIGTAELEALRITERCWFNKPPDGQIEEKADVRDRVWSVVSDIVAALAQCRIDHSFFHRSVYRHAQALMWAPIFCDPVAGRAEGSLGTVPATRSYHIRGLNNATNAASSAAVVMSSLFEKKR